MTYLSALYTAAQRSHHHQHRLGLAVTSLEDAIHQINIAISGEVKRSHCVENVVRSIPNQKVVFVFSGMGTQWWGMGRELMQSTKVFAATIRVSQGVWELMFIWS